MPRLGDDIEVKGMTELNVKKRAMSTEWEYDNLSLHSWISQTVKDVEWSQTTDYELTLVSEIENMPTM